MSLRGHLTAAEIRRRVAAREGSAEEVTRAHLERIEQHDSDIGAFLCVLPGRALAKNPRIKEYFTELQSKMDYDVNDLKAGREYVAAYVHFIHYVEAQFGGNAVEDTHNEHKH